MQQDRPWTQTTKTYVFRLRPGDDLKESLQSWAREHAITAGAIITCVGSLTQYAIRFANRPSAIQRKGFFEILSLTGTLSERAAHLHICVADENGNTTGGHLMAGSLIYTTAEIVVATYPELVFTRVHDSTYGYAELDVAKKN